MSDILNNIQYARLLPELSQHDEELNHKPSYKTISELSNEANSEVGQETGDEASDVQMCFPSDDVTDIYNYPDFEYLLDADFQGGSDSDYDIESEFNGF